MVQPRCIVAQTSVLFKLQTSFRFETRSIFREIFSSNYVLLLSLSIIHPKQGSKFRLVSDCRLNWDHVVTIFTFKGDFHKIWFTKSGKRFADQFLKLQVSPYSISLLISDDVETLSARQLAVSCNLNFVASPASLLGWYGRLRKTLDFKNGVKGKLKHSTSIFCIPTLF